MKSLRIIAAWMLCACADAHNPADTLTPVDTVTKKVAGRMRFLLGGTAAAGSSVAAARGGAGAQLALVAGEGYIVSPNQAKITISSVTFRSATGILGESTFTDCIVTIDRSRPSGSTLLDCPFTVPIGEVRQIVVNVDKTFLVLVNDPVTGIYSATPSPPRYSTSPPAGGAVFVPFIYGCCDASPSTGIAIVLPTPLIVTEGSTPNLYITADLIHTLKLGVNSGGTTLSDMPSGLPVEIFGGTTPGTSRYYNAMNTIETFKIGVPNYGVRIFYDEAETPLYVFGGTGACGFEVSGNKSAHASPPLGHSSPGGWLGRDANKDIAWALAADADYTAYTVYMILAERSVIGQITTLKCKASASPPPPADGKTYASGAPAMPAPFASMPIRLLAK